MFEHLLAVVAAEAIDKTSEVAKGIGEKVSNVQKAAFEKVVEHNKEKTNAGIQVWLEESSIIKKGFASEKEYRKYCVYNMQDHLLYQAITGNIEKRVSLSITDGSDNSIATVTEGGSFMDKLNAEYRISVGDFNTYTAIIDYNQLKPCIELRSKDWKLNYDLIGVKSITDGNNCTLAEVNTKIGKRRLINIYTNESRLCIILIIIGIVNGVRFIHLQ